MYTLFGHALLLSLRLDAYKAPHMACHNLNLPFMHIEARETLSAKMAASRTTVNVSFGHLSDHARGVHTSLRILPDGPTTHADDLEQ